MRLKYLQRIHRLIHTLRGPYATRKDGGAVQWLLDMGYSIRAGLTNDVDFWPTLDESLCMLEEEHIHAPARQAEFDRKFTAAYEAADDARRSRAAAEVR
jgi:hypothetical protein